MMHPDTWTYAGDDECAQFFTQCLKVCPPRIPANATVLEIGCSEFNWMQPAAQAWPEMSFIGVDWREGEDAEDGHIVRKRADIRDATLFASHTFDWIVSISAIEHIGLGHYDHDPIDPDGDVIAIANAFRWLKPGGWLMFDVPYHPRRYEVIGTSHREYNDDALVSRLWLKPLELAYATAKWHWTGYVVPRGPLLLERPTDAVVPFHYVGIVGEKLS